MLSNTTKLKGLYTFGNELLQPEGSLAIADNVNIDEPNVITQRRGFNDYADELLNDTLRFRQVLSYKDELIRHYSDKLQFYRNGQFETFSGSYLELNPDIRIKYVTASGNLYFTTSEGIKKISALTATDFSTGSGYITNAGVPEALDVFGKVVYSTTGFLPPESKVAYKVLFGKKDVNNNLLLGAPSSRYVVTNTSKDVFTFEKTNLIFKLNEDFRVEKNTLTVSNYTNTNQTTGNNSILKVHSANNTYKYAFWFNKGSGIAPSLVGYTNVEVNISSLSGTPSDSVGTLLYNAAIAANLQGITVTLANTTTLVFENTIEGKSDGLTTPTNNIVADIGSGWAIANNITGTESNYIGKYFLVNSPDKEYCFYYGNTRTIEDVPNDPALLGKTFVGIEIGNQSTKAFISNATYRALLNNISDSYEFDLDVTVSNPVLTLTNTTGGDINDTKQGTILTSVIEVLILNQGSIAEGQFANVDVTFTVPTGVDTTYFYRIYRTSFVSVSTGVTINDLDPGEECNLVYEGSVTVAAGQEITVQDITNENFRNSGEPLYNNPISGEGILQSNTIPPVSVDICNYKTYTFYGNTKINHQQALSLVTVDGLVSGTSKFSIVNSDVKRDYTFRGVAASYTLVCGTKSNTKVHKAGQLDSKIYLYSALDETKYVVYFDDGTATKPSDTDAVLIAVNISNLASGDNVAETLQATLAQFNDFSVSRVSSTLTLVNSENGQSTKNDTPNSNIVTNIGTGWSLTRDVVGLGEDKALGFILLSKSASVGIKLERTARSLVSVINADILSPVNAYYTSSLTDLPGRFLLKARSIEDQYFYSYITGATGDIFNPEIPTVEAGFKFSAITTGAKTRLTKVAHGFANGEEVYIYVPNAVPAINGTFNVTLVSADIIEINATTTSGTITDSFYFFPFEKSDNLKSPNRIYYSKFSQPEAVPIVNYIDIGTKDAPIERILALRDYLFIFKTDGIYMLSGDGGIWTVRMIDTEKILCPDSAIVLNNQIYLLTGNGVMTVNENTPFIIARMIEDKFQVLQKFKSSTRRLGFGVGYEDDRAYILWVPSESTDEVCTQAYRYNILEKMWTRWTKTATCGVVVENGNNSLLYIADGDRPIIMQERKNRDRTDFADNVLTVELGLDSFVNNKYRLSSISDVSVGDVITQTQYLNVSEYNRFLQKLDIDTGLGFTSFFADYEVGVSDNLANILNDLNNKLVKLDTSGTVTARTFNNADWVVMQSKFNSMIAELNNPACVTQFKNYAQSSGTIMFEYIITEVVKSSNDVKVFGETQLIQGKLNVYRHIKSIVQTNPIHFGNPSGFKQVSKGYLLFDQNNFFNMLLEYATDLSPSFEGQTFKGKGPGYWGYDTWGFENKNYWGGDGNDAPRRVIIPRNKQRCRYITVRFTHNVARDVYRVVGVAHDVREFSSNAYR